MLIQSLFNNWFEIWRSTPTSDGQGGWEKGFTQIGLVEGRMSSASASERTVGAQEQSRLSHIFYCLAGEDVRREDEIRLGSLVWKVLAIREPSLAQEHLQIDCQEIQRKGEPSP